MQYEHSSMREYTGKRKNREVLCEKALKLYEEKFKDGTSIGTFHQEKDENVFLDTEEEEYRQYVELAWKYFGTCKNKDNFKDWRFYSS